jgi:hypothetical protein
MRAYPLVVAALFAGAAACAANDAISSGDSTDAKNGGCEISGDDDDSVGAVSSCSATKTSTPDKPVGVLSLMQLPVACATVDDKAAFWVELTGKIGVVSTTFIPSIGSPTPAYAAEAYKADTTETCGMARDGDYLWVTQFKAGSILRLKVIHHSDETYSFDDDALVIAGFSTPSSIVVDAKYVYVTEFDPGAVRRIPKPATAADAGTDAGEGYDGGAEANVVLGMIGTKAHRLFSDGASLFWSSYDTGADQYGLRKMPIGGGDVDTLSADETAIDSAEIVRVGASLYWLCSGNSICSVPVAGGLTSILALDVATDASSSSSSSSGNSGQQTTTTQVLQAHALASDGTVLYVSDGLSMYRYAGGVQKLFTASETSRDSRLFIQPNRLTWFAGDGLHTKPLETTVPEGRDQ